MRRIDEVSYADITPLGECLKRNSGQNRYIHFSKINKMGVNVKKHHSDPAGVYFYPVDWLLSAEKFHDHEQFATNWPYFFVVDIDFSKPGLDMSTITDEGIRELAQRNGWLDAYVNYKPTYKLRRGDAQAMWDVLQSLNRRSDPTAKKSWMQTLRGMAWIKDTTGIIMAHEPEQVCVMDPRCMRIVESGTQPELHSHDWEKWDYWRQPFVNILKAVQTNHGGEIAWKNKRPILTVSGDNWQFSVSWSDSYSSGGISIAMKTGRATDQTSISTSKMRKLDIAEIVKEIEDHLSVCQNFDGNDLDFVPALSHQQVEQLIGQHIYDAPKPKWEIMKGHNFMRADIHTTKGYPPCSNMFAVGVSSKSAWVMCTLKVNGQLVASISQTAPENFEQQFMNTFKMYCPGQPREDDYRTFDPEEWEPFLGWLFVQSGLKMFEPYEEKFSRYPNVRDLYRQIERVFSRVGW